MERDLRLPALRRFAIAITVLNLLGHTVLGFEQSWAHLLTAILTAYAVEFLLESADAWTKRRRPRYLSGPIRTIDFFLSPHISGCAVAMLLYPNARLMPVAFAAATAIASKTLFRVNEQGRSRHFLNPSNFGITVTLLAFPWVGIAPPYQFTENLGTAGDWILPLVIITTGTFLNARFTRKLPLIAGWLLGFASQAVIRTAVLGTSTISALLPMTGVAFILFTFYMVTDPATTPATRRNQLLFGASVALAYGVLMAFHVVFGLFFALTAVTAGRGVAIWLTERVRRPLAAPITIAAGRSEA